MGPIAKTKVCQTKPRISGFIPISCRFADPFFFFVVVVISWEKRESHLSTLQKSWALLGHFATLTWGTPPLFSKFRRDVWYFGSCLIQNQKKKRTPFSPISPVFFFHQVEKNLPVFPPHFPLCPPVFLCIFSTFP